MTRWRLFVVSAAMLGMIAIAPLGAQPPSCMRDVSGVTWIRWNGRQDILNQWCESVGPPVFTTAPPRAGALSRLLVVSWNVHVGGADVDELMAKVIGPLS